jgi:hypothetical protein
MQQIQHSGLDFQLSVLLSVFVWIIKFVVCMHISLKVPPKNAKQLCLNNSHKQTLKDYFLKLKATLHHVICATVTLSQPFSVFYAPFPWSHNGIV